MPLATSFSYTKFKFRSFFLYFCLVIILNISLIMMIILIYIILYLPLSVLGVVTPKLLGEQNNYTLRNMVREYNNSNT